MLGIFMVAGSFRQASSGMGIAGFFLPVAVLVFLITILVVLLKPSGS